MEKEVELGYNLIIFSTISSELWGSVKPRIFCLHSNVLSNTILLENQDLLLKSHNLQYNMVGRWVDRKIFPQSDGPMFILIDWE